MKWRNPVRVVTYPVKIVQDLLQINVYNVKVITFSLKPPAMKMVVQLVLFNLITHLNAKPVTLIAKLVLILIIVFIYFLKIIFNIEYF